MKLSERAVDEFQVVFLAVLAFFFGGGFWSYFQILWRFLRRFRYFSYQNITRGPILGQNEIRRPLRGHQAAKATVL